MHLPHTPADPDISAELAELELIYAATPVPICVIDRDLRFTRANREYCELVQRKLDEIVGRRMEEVVHPLAREVTLGLVKNVIETGRAARNLELAGMSRTHPPQERVWILNAHPVKKDGKVTAVIGLLQDVTAPKRLEQMARERLDELESIYRNVPVGLALVDTSLRYVRVNDVMAQLNARSVEDHVGRSIYEVVPDLDPAFEPFVRDIFAGKQLPRSYEFRVTPPSDPGVEHALMVRYELVRGDDGTISGLVASIMDVTDRVRAEEEARAARDYAESQLEELEMIYANTPVGLCILDSERRTLRINEQMARATGLPIQENIGRSAYEIASGLIEQIDEPLRLAFDLGRPSFNVEMNGPLPSDPRQLRNWLVNVHPARMRQGTVQAVLIVVQDVTNLRRQQDELAEVKARLEEAQRMTRVGNWDWDLVDDVMWWSQELYQLTGQRQGHFQPSWNSFFELVHPEDRPDVRRQLEATLERDAPYWVEFRVVLPDLSERVLRCAARLERSDDGRPRRLIGTCQDVTRLGAWRPTADPTRFDVEST